MDALLLMPRYSADIAGRDEMLGGLHDTSKIASYSIEQLHMHELKTRPSITKFFDFFRFSYSSARSFAVIVLP